MNQREYELAFNAGVARGKKQAEAENARLREALERADAVAMRAGGGTGWGPLAEIHDIARNALKETR